MNIFEIVFNSYIVTLVLALVILLFPLIFYNRKLLGTFFWIMGFYYFIIYLSYEYSISFFIGVFIALLSGTFAIFYNFIFKIPKLYHDCGGIKNLFLSYVDIFRLKKGNKSIIEKHKKDELTYPHIGILIAKKRTQFSEMDTNVYADGIDLLINFFLRNMIQFNIYECSTPQSAKEIIINPNISGLFIFGHGTKCSLYFGLNGTLHYCEVRDAPRKKVIGQLHCNSNEGCGCSLADYILEDDGKKLINEGYSFVHKNRVEIEKFILENEDDLIKILIPRNII